MKNTSHRFSNLLSFWLEKKCLLKNLNPLELAFREAMILFRLFQIPAYFEQGLRHSLQSLSSEV